SLPNREERREKKSSSGVPSTTCMSGFSARMAIGIHGRFLSTVTAWAVPLMTKENCSLGSLERKPSSVSSHDRNRGKLCTGQPIARRYGALSGPCAGITASGTGMGDELDQISAPVPEVEIAPDRGFVDFTAV